MVAEEIVALLGLGSSFAEVFSGAIARVMGREMTRCASTWSSRWGNSDLEQ